jgi:protoporphyrin/coproporphyrin ferrochelatase
VASSEPVKSRAGVLLINIGTPDAPTPEAIRRYLREFLSDPRVVDLPRLVWWPILHGVILPFRPARLVPQYAHIWRDEGSPLMVIAREQRAALEMRLLRELTVPVAVAKAMRYGSPGIEAALVKLRHAGAGRVAVLPLYPQHSLTTSGSAFDAVHDALDRIQWWPELRRIGSYHAHPRYIGALAESVREHWAVQGRSQLLLMSFHGIPARYTRAGDPYETQCRGTAELLASALQLKPDEWQVAFQSRVGKARWSQPYTDEVLRGLPARGVRRIDVIAPGFAADCLETLDEIASRYARAFVDAGGDALRYVPALNAHPSHIDALAQIVIEHLA